MDHIPKGPNPPRDMPAMGVGATMLSLNQAMMRQLASVRRIRLEFEDGKPIIIPDANGWAVTKHTSHHQYTGFIKAPAILKPALAILPPDSKWEMVWNPDTKRWHGRRWEPEGAERPDYVRIPRSLYDELRYWANIGKLSRIAKDKEETA